MNPLLLHTPGVSDGEIMTRYTSRRKFMAATAAVGAALGLNASVLAQDGGGEDEQYILLGGNTAGWEPYRLPGEESVEEASTNPTLTLESDTTYTLAWVNVDGQPHNFAIQDSDGEPLQVLQPVELSSDEFEQLNQTEGNETQMETTEMEGDENETDAETTTVSEEDLVDSTENVTEEGAVQAVRFTASDEMATYICQVHPNTMVGDIELGEGGGTETDGDENESA